MVNANEFSHVVKLNEIGAGESPVRLSASADERAGLAARFDLAGLDTLDAELMLSCDADGVLAQGRFNAVLAQHCVATGEPVSAIINETVNIRFVNEPVVDPGAEIELEADDCDSMFHDGQGVDLGEAVAQSLGLALDPYPRRPGAQDALKAAGVLNEETAGPFSALAALRDKMKP